MVKHREGGDPSSSHKSIGRTEYDPITLSREVTHDPAFEDWANLVFLHGAGLRAETHLKNMRKTLPSRFTTKPANLLSLIRFFAAGPANTEPYRSSMLMRMPWRSRL
jgi:phage tail-like protein